MSDTTGVCANELLLRNAIIQKMVLWWNVVESFRLPETALGSERIGRETAASPPEVIADVPRPVADESVPGDTQAAVAVDASRSNVVAEIELTWSPAASQNL